MFYKAIYDLGMASWQEASDSRFPRDMACIDRTLGGLFGNLGKLDATGPWRKRLREYTAPATSCWRPLRWLLSSWPHPPDREQGAMSQSVDDAEHPRDSAEKLVLDAVASRQVADLLTLPEAERRLSADFLQRLIDGSHEALCGPLRIRGATVSGPVRTPLGVREGSRAAVQFRDCRFDSPVDLSGAEFLILQFVDCTLPAFIGSSLSVSADLELTGSRFTGVTNYESELSDVGSCSIHLMHARIGGKLDLSSSEKQRFSAVGTIRLDGSRVDGDVSLAGATLDGRGEPALSARSAVVGSNVELRPAGDRRFEAQGAIIFAAAEIAGDLNCEGARLVNPGGRAMHCEDLEVESVFLIKSTELNAPFEARGRLNFLTAVINGSFFMTNARLTPGPDYQGVLRKGGPIVINLQQARISNALAFSNIGEAPPDGDASLDTEPAPLNGWFLMTGTQMTAIIDDVDTGWPGAGYLDIDGAMYSDIRHMGDGDLTTRSISWLKRQYANGTPDRRSFRPQPYEQLTRVLRDSGRTVEANAIAVEKIRMRLAARIDRPWARFFPNLLMLVSNYGYSTSRAVMSFLVFLLLGTGIYATALFGFEQPFVPVENEPEPVTYEFAFGLLKSSVEAGCPGLDPMHYALDAALPVIDLAQDLRCRFTPDGPFRGLWLLLHSLFVLGGAALSAVVVLTLSGVLRQD